MCRAGRKTLLTHSLHCVNLASIRRRRRQRVVVEDRSVTHE